MGHTLNNLEEQAARVKASSRLLSQAGTQQRNAVLAAIADKLEANVDLILTANAKDLAASAKSYMLDRLTLSEQRILDMAAATRQLIELPDPIGQIIKGWERPNGLIINQKRVPIGTIGIIYEARPNVTVDAAALCIKSGNSVLLRGGSEAFHSNLILCQLMQEALESVGLPKYSLDLVANTSREAATEMMKLNDFLDLLIPRGGAGLIKSVVQNATVPVIETGSGICHTYVDASADLEMALKILINAKCQRPSVCNSCETLIVHEAVAPEFLPRLLDKGIELRGDKKAQQIIDCEVATDEDFATEYNDLILNIKVVTSLDEAIAHINHFSSHHSETIVTSDYANSQKFLAEVDSAAVYINASTRFTDGFEFGFGAEIGISTQKLHARGPMGLEALTTTKYQIFGSGQIRE